MQGGGEREGSERESVVWYTWVGERQIGFRAVGAWFTILYSPIETARLFVTEVAL